MILTQQEALDWAAKLLGQPELTPLALSYALMAAYARGQMNPKPVR